MYWRLDIKRPSGSTESFDLRNQRAFTVGDAFENDICIETTLVPFQFKFLYRSLNNQIRLRLTEETRSHLKGKFLKRKDWKTKLYQGEEYEIVGETSWEIAGTSFQLSKVSPPVLTSEKTPIDPLSQKHFRQSAGLSAGIHALLFLFFLGVTYFGRISDERVEVQKVSVAAVEKVFEKPVPPAPAPAAPVEEPEIKAPQKETPKTTLAANDKNSKSLKTKKTVRKSHQMQGGSGKAPKKPRQVENLGLLAIQTTSAPSTSLKVSAVQTPGGIAVASAAKDIRLGIGNGSGFGVGNGTGKEPPIAEIGEISGESYQGGIGDKVGSGRGVGVQLVRKEVEVRGGLDPAVIRQIIEERLSEVRYCYENALLKNANLKGKIATQWTIQSDGSVAQLVSSSDEIAPSILHSCVKEQIRKWKFPQPKGGGVVHVKYPFVFSPVGS